MTTKGTAADVDMGADAVADVGDITAAVAADAEDLAGVATTVAAGADIMVGVKVINRFRMEVINKVKVMNTIMTNNDTIRNSNIIKLDHHPTSKGSPTTTWGQPGMVAIPIQRHPVSTRVCALQGCLVETTSLWAPITQFQAGTSSLKWE